MNQIISPVREGNRFTNVAKTISFDSLAYGYVDYWIMMQVAEFTKMMAGFTKLCGEAGGVSAFLEKICNFAVDSESV